MEILAEMGDRIAAASSFNGYGSPGGMTVRNRLDQR
jgi:hypothetical protein